jgi:hypothetical protein
MSVQMMVFTRFQPIRTIVVTVGQLAETMRRALCPSALITSDHKDCGFGSANRCPHSWVVPVRLQSPVRPRLL